MMNFYLWSNFLIPLRTKYFLHACWILLAETISLKLANFNSFKIGKILAKCLITLKWDKCYIHTSCQFLKLTNFCLLSSSWLVKCWNSAFLLYLSCSLPWRAFLSFFLMILARFLLTAIWRCFCSACNFSSFCFLSLSSISLWLESCMSLT